MAATLKSRQVDDVIVIDFEGRIVLGGGSSTLRDAVRDLVVNRQTKILLNLADVTYIDSSGLGELVAAFTAVSNYGGQFKILNLTKRVKDLLQITKLYTVFDIHDDEAHALRSFACFCDRLVSSVRCGLPGLPQVRLPAKLDRPATGGQCAARAEPPRLDIAILNDGAYERMYDL